MVSGVTSPLKFACLRREDPYTKDHGYPQPRRTTLTVACNVSSSASNPAAEGRSSRERDERGNLKGVVYQTVAREVDKVRFDFTCEGIGAYQWPSAQARHQNTTPRVTRA